jgi:hypothetical protein
MVLIGIVIALRETDSRPVAACLALVMASYYVGFINVILYNYDPVPPGGVRRAGVVRGHRARSSASVAA